MYYTVGAFQSTPTDRKNGVGANVYRTFGDNVQAPMSAYCSMYLRRGIGPAITRRQRKESLLRGQLLKGQFARSNADGGSNFANSNLA